MIRGGGSRNFNDKHGWRVVLTMSECVWGGGGGDAQYWWCCYQHSDISGSGKTALVAHYVSQVRRGGNDLLLSFNCFTSRLFFTSCSTVSLADSLLHMDLKPFPLPPLLILSNISRSSPPPSFSYQPGRCLFLLFLFKCVFPNARANRDSGVFLCCINSGDWPGRCLFCCYQFSCFVSQQSWFWAFFLFHKFSDLTPLRSANHYPMPWSSRTSVESPARLKTLRKPQDKITNLTLSDIFQYSLVKFVCLIDVFLSVLL